MEKDLKEDIEKYKNTNYTEEFKENAERVLNTKLDNVKQYIKLYDKNKLTVKLEEIKDLPLQFSDSRVCLRNLTSFISYYNDLRNLFA